jgi:hypothetical protein
MRGKRHIGCGIPASDRLTSGYPEGVAPLSQHLRRIDTVFAPEVWANRVGLLKPCSAAIRASASV